MKLISIYKPFVGKEPKFVDSFPQDTQDLAVHFWASLNSSCLFFVLFLVVISVCLCIYYFTAYNEQPGRHYRRTHWVGFYIGTVVFMFLGTAVLGYILTNPTVKGFESLIWDIALGNAVYSIAIFGVLSFIWWLFALPTNAYIGTRK